jgi:TetR/AcrR family transcriptional repressor of bet genes
MPRKPNGPARQAEMVAALQKVMARVGYEKATIQAIAREAGLAPGLVHYHFHNKQEILICLVAAIADYAKERFAHVAESAVAPDARLDAYLKARLGLGDGASAERVAAWVMIGAEAVRQPEVREIYQRILGEELAGLTTLLRDCLIHRKRDTRASRSIAAGLLAMMEGAFQLSSAAAPLMPRGYAYQAASNFARLSVGAAPSS